MLLKSIYLYNFRTFLDNKFTFQAINNLIIAPNGQGKSNLIEAINFFSSAKSFKTNINKEIINFNQKEASLISEISNNNKKSKINIIFKEDGYKKIIINNSLLKQTSDLLQEFTTILVSPNDVSIIDGQPSIRRKYVDTILSKISNGYLNNIKSYKKIIDIKRKFLKTNQNDQLLSIYQEQQENVNKIITNNRKQLLLELQEKINLYLKKYYPKIGSIEIKYTDTFINMDCVKEKEYRECLYGSHRDDFDILLNKISVKKYSSTGEKRLISLLFKMSEKQIFNTTLGIKPVLLLDDAFLGLDDERQTIFYSLIETDHQKIITSTDEKYIKIIKDPYIIQI